MSRDHCASCNRPVSECYCDAIINIDNPVKVVILQHPMESDHPYNTGSMAHRSLQRSQLHIGEVFSADLISDLVSQHSLLLFPEMPWLKSPKAINYEPEQLVVIDATWRKAKKILHLNPALQELPRMAINNPPNSDYVIRSSTVSNSLATLEAIQMALSSLDQSTDYKDLLSPFQKMISLARRYMPDSD